MTASRPSRIGLLVVAVGVAFVLFLPRADMLDARMRFKDLELVLRGEKTQEKFSMVGPLFATPLYFIGQLKGEELRCVWYFNRVLILLGCAGFWWLLQPILTAEERTRFVVALLLTSMMPHHLLHFGAEVFSSLLMALGLAAVILRRAWWGTPLATVAVVNAPGTIGGLALALIVVVMRTRRLRHLLAIPTAAALVLLENYIRRGDPFFTGYVGEHGVANALPFSGQAEFSYPIAFGVMSLLISFGKGLIFFVPAVFLPMPSEPQRRSESEADLRWLYRAWIAVIVGLVLLYARWWSWYGGFFWGPRFLLFACFPAALVIARRTANPHHFSTGANLLLLVVLSLGSWVALNGVVYQQIGLEQYNANNHALEFVVWYVPECSVLWWPYTNPHELLWDEPFYPIATMIGLVYLAAPVIATLARRLPSQLSEAWVAFRTEGRFRF